MYITSCVSNCLSVCHYRIFCSLTGTPTAPVSELQLIPGLKKPCTADHQTIFSRDETLPDAPGPSNLLQE